MSSIEPNRVFDYAWLSLILQVLQENKILSADFNIEVELPKIINQIDDSKKSNEK